MRIDTRPGQGTTVCVFLRRTEHAVEDRLAAAAGAEKAGATPGATILVIDDDVSVRRSLVAMLQIEGHHVIEASNGHDSLSALAQGPDLILLDFAMPGMNGAEVAEAVRRTHPDLPIIFVTGYGDTAAIAQAIGDGALVLRKPFDLEQLETAIDRQLRPRRLSSSG